MLSRILVGIIGALILISGFIEGNILLLLLTEVIVVLSSLELIMMMKIRENGVRKIILLILAATIPFIVYLGYNEIYVLILFLIGIGTLQILEEDVVDSTSKTANKLFILIYVPVLFSYILKIRTLEEGTALIMFSFFIVWVCDTFAYIFGMNFGKHKFSYISPKKSVEGIIGGFIGVLLVSRFFGYIHYVVTLIYSCFGISYPRFVEFFDKFDINLILFSIVITAISVLGDLFESKIKREYGVKDSSKLLLEHGGFLDRFDSSLFVLPIVYMIFKFLV